MLLAVGTRGGRCVDGPCESVVLVDRDGRVHLAAKPPNELGVVSPDLMAALDAAIRTTDFAELFSHPFTGECPTAYDGQELVFEFATPDGVQRLASCTVEVDYDSPLFTAVRAAVGEFVPLVRLGKRYVYYIFLSWPVDGPFAATISPALKPHMQGKPCFKFSRVDSDRLWADWLSSRRACADIRILDESFDVPSSTPGPGCGGTSDG